MNDLDRWQADNEEYLAAALAWLRLRLVLLAKANRPHKESSSGSRLGWRRPEPPESEATTYSKVRAAAKVMEEAAKIEPPPALLILGQRLHFSPFEREVLLLCAAMELDTRIAALCAHAQGNPNRPYPTFSLALALFDDPAWDVLSPERPLRYWRLLEISQPGAQPLTTSPLRADERIVNYLKGLNYLDDRMTPLMVPFDVAPGEQAKLSPSQQADVDRTVRYIRHASANGSPLVIQLAGSDSLSKQLVALKAAAELGTQLYRLPAELLPTQAGELETIARLWQRESILLSIALYLDAQEMDGWTQTDAGAQRVTPPLHRFLRRGTGLVFLDTREILPGLGRDNLASDVGKPSTAEQQVAWTDVLQASTQVSPAHLAGQFNLNLPTIHRIARAARAEAAGSGGSQDDHLWGACLIRTRPRLETLAERIETQTAWDDIVLPDDQLGLLKQIAHQVRHRTQVYDEWGFREKMTRGLGISALFAGASGTGKTMAAEIMANDLHLDLYRIDLSAVVSKYIGETEKNLRRLFDAAEDGGAILFFDEADALFGKRSEVKDSHDRYANIEINYLLQRMEAYRGLAILATNLKTALDRAFMRRIRFTVGFPYPDLEQRKLIWEKVFPPQTPTEAMDCERLARLNLTGGSIHNIALNAAFLAAEAGTPVTMSLLLAAARTEMRKLDRPVNEADFVWRESSGTSSRP